MVIALLTPMLPKLATSLDDIVDDVSANIAAVFGVTLIAKAAESLVVLPSLTRTLIPVLLATASGVPVNVPSDPMLNHDGALTKL